MCILPGREYHIYRRYQGDDGVTGEQLTEKPLISGIWCAMQTMYRMSLLPENYLLDAYLKLVSYTSEGKEVLCAAILLEKADPTRTYFLRYTNGMTKHTYDVCTLNNGLWCAIGTMCRYREERSTLFKHTDGRLYLGFYQGKSVITKVVLQLGATG